MNDENSSPLTDTSVNNLLDLLRLQSDAIVSRTIVKKDSGNITVFAFGEGQALSEHTAPYDAMLYILQGKAAIRIDKRDFMVSANEYIILPAGIPHALKAEQDLKMLLIMLKS